MYFGFVGAGQSGYVGAGQSGYKECQKNVAMNKFVF
jgi:hypothetical protein